MTTVYFRQGTCRIALHLDELPALPNRNITRLFDMMLSEPWVNEQAIAAVNPFLNMAAADSKAVWAQASTEYTNGWRLVRSKKSRRPQDLEILRENKRLTAAVKRTKAQYERWVKIQNIWINCKGE